MCLALFYATDHSITHAGLASGTPTLNTQSVAFPIQSNQASKNHRSPISGGAVVCMRSVVFSRQLLGPDRIPHPAPADGGGSSLAPDRRGSTPKLLVKSDSQHPSATNAPATN